MELFQAEWCSGAIEIPRLVTDDGDVLTGEDEILPWLEDRFAERPDAERHREKLREFA